MKSPHINDNILRIHFVAPSHHETLPCTCAQRESFRFYSAFDGWHISLGKEDVRGTHRAIASTFCETSFSYGSHIMVSVKGIRKCLVRFVSLSASTHYAYHNFQPIFSETYVNNVVPNRITVHHRWHQCDLMAECVSVASAYYSYQERCVQCSPLPTTKAGQFNFNAKRHQEECSIRSK